MGHDYITELTTDLDLTWTPGACCTQEHAAINGQLYRLGKEQPTGTREARQEQVNFCF